MENIFNSNTGKTNNRLDMKDKIIQAPIKGIRNEDFKFSMAIFANK